LEERGKYQGILGASFGMGNVLGPFMAAAFIERATWRALFWLITPVSGVVGFITYFILPSVKPTDGIKEKVKKIDYLGIITSAVALIFSLDSNLGGWELLQVE
jgi:MFS family permease